MLVRIAAVALRARLFAVIGLPKPVVFVPGRTVPDPRRAVRRNLVAMGNPPRVSEGHGDVVPLLCVPVIFRCERVRDFVQHRLLALVE